MTISIPSVTTGGSVECDSRKARTKLVFPAPPRPTNINFVLLHAVDPLINRFKNAIVCWRPRRVISIGGVFNETQPVKLSSFNGKSPTFGLNVSNSIQQFKFNKVKYVKFSIASGTLLIAWYSNESSVKFRSENITDGNPDVSVLNEGCKEISDSVVLVGSADDRPELGWKEQNYKQ